ncbi:MULTISPECIES: DUF3375 domain-containing protein [unclassified Oceanispirochaeta]|uniref:DUF3375 domain-containing protein n=1 Tax=unclassified Oceanispirochaeta TaxID=2635722 RepID=UPI000E096B46|nr:MULTISPECIES: DUF3375 domain-containing protein [unclassified Oceanispirochaeta]MBF9015971.1 DUF3375 domain-containing protein [Oceanispirochaeta sp. M2]NPD72434.1 DUF3375 domain-containing protein [Oceanispirochaeta sp. M1]RDG32201.1 DUF3375 domain-containing protein [Oceanispirochaeta sp. M1]
MSLEYYALLNMRKNHPAWRLMTADNAPLIAGFLDLAFIQSNRREQSETELTLLLDDYLFQLRDASGEDAFPREAGGYLDEWCRNDRAWLRKFYPQGSDEPHFDLTPAIEKALQWLESLTATTFVGTESRLMTCVDLLKQMVTGVEMDRDLRLAELREERASLDREIEAVKEGNMPLLDDRELRERYHQFSLTARELLHDFRAVEHNFRELDRSVRERITAWSGDKGGLLDAIFGEEDAINNSDEGRSFQGFWDFLMSPESQEELTALLERVFSIKALGEFQEDRRLRRIHFDWMAAGEQTQRTVALLSRQLRRYLENQNLHENRRITALLNSIEQGALELREDAPSSSSFMSVDHFKAALRMPMELPLFRIPIKQELNSRVEEAEKDEMDTSVLFSQVVVDKGLLKERILRSLNEKDHLTLKSLIKDHPLDEGLAELMAYVSLAEDDSHAYVSDEDRDSLEWTDREGRRRKAQMPRVYFSSKTNKEKKR